MAEGTAAPETNIAPPPVEAFPQAGEAPKKSGILDRLKSLLSFLKRKKSGPSEAVKPPTEVTQGEVDDNAKQWAASSETTFPAPAAPSQEPSTFPTSAQLDQKMVEQTPGYRPKPSSASIESLVDRMHQDLKKDKEDEEKTPDIAPSPDEQKAA